jgi:hypothetical protein
MFVSEEVQGGDLLLWGLGAVTQGLDESSPYAIPKDGRPTGLTEADMMTVQSA